MREWVYVLNVSFEVFMISNFDEMIYHTTLKATLQAFELMSVIVSFNCEKSFETCHRVNSVFTKSMKMFLAQKLFQEL